MNRDYFNDQVAYSRFLLSTTKEDLTAWQIARGNPVGIALCLVRRMRELACAAALCQRIGESEIIDWVKAELSYLPKGIRANLLKVVLKFSKTMVGDTFENVEKAAKIIVENLMNPLFEKQTDGKQSAQSGP